MISVNSTLSFRGVVLLQWHNLLLSQKYKIFAVWTKFDYSGVSVHITLYIPVFASKFSKFSKNVYIPGHHLHRNPLFWKSKFLKFSAMLIYTGTYIYRDTTVVFTQHSSRVVRKLKVKQSALDLLQINIFLFVWVSSLLSKIAVFVGSGSWPLEMSGSRHLLETSKLESTRLACFQFFIRTSNS